MKVLTRVLCCKWCRISPIEQAYIQVDKRTQFGLNYLLNTPKSKVGFLNFLPILLMFDLDNVGMFIWMLIHFTNDLKPIPIISFHEIQFQHVYIKKWPKTCF